MTYTDFIMSGGEIFPKDMYWVSKTSFKKIKYYPFFQIYETNLFR
jgi:hypothetical protein